VVPSLKKKINKIIYKCKKRNNTLDDPLRENYSSAPFQDTGLPEQDYFDRYQFGP
jgi:hypothetical protein